MTKIQKSNALNFKCSVCNKLTVGKYGNNPAPIQTYERTDEQYSYCCDKCNYEIVVPARVKQAQSWAGTTTEVAIEATKGTIH